MTTAAIYVRVSTPGQEDGASLPQQEERCRAYAADQGYEIDEAHVYREVWSGVDLWQRPQVTALRQAMRDRAVDVVLAFSTDRLSRDQDHLIFLFTEAARAGVSIELATERLDDSPQGQLLRYVSGWAARWEHTKITQRTQDGRIARVVKGGKPLRGAVTKYGYRVATEDDLAEAKGDDPTLTSGLAIDQAAATVVRRIYEGALAGVPVRTIAKALSADGIPSAKGRAYWPVCTVFSILKDRMYIGEFQAFTRTNYQPKSAAYERPAPVTLAVPALIDPATFEAVQQQLAVNKRYARRNNQHAEDYLLRGMVRCAYTGLAMVAQLQGGKWPGYRCQSRRDTATPCTVHAISAALLDEHVWNQVVATLSDEELMAAHLRDLIEDDGTAADLAGVEQTIAKLDADIEHTATVIAEERIASLRERHRARYADLEAQRDHWLAEREALLARRAEWQAAIAEVDDLRVWCAEAREEFQTMDRDERRRRLQQLQVQVFIKRATEAARLAERVEIRAAVPITVAVVSSSSRWSTT